MDLIRQNTYWKHKKKMQQDYHDQIHHQLNNDLPLLKAQIRIKKVQLFGKGSSGLGKKYKDAWVSLIANGKILAVYYLNSVIFPFNFHC